MDLVSTRVFNSNKLNIDELPSGSFEPLKRNASCLEVLIGQHRPGGGTPIYGLYGYVPLNRVCFLLL